MHRWNSQVHSSEGSRWAEQKWHTFMLNTVTLHPRYFKYPIMSPWSTKLKEIAGIRRTHTLEYWWTMGLLRKSYTKTTSKKTKPKTTNNMQCTKQRGRSAAAAISPQSLWCHKEQALFSSLELNALYLLLLYLHSNRSWAKQLRGAEIRTHSATPLPHLSSGQIHPFLSSGPNLGVTL